MKTKQKTKGRRGRGSRKSRTRASGNPSPDAAAYWGPVFTRNDEMQNDVVVRVLAVAGPISSNGTGSIIGVISNNPSASPDWASYVTSYEEYRILAEQLDYVPVYESFANTPGLAYLQSNLAYALSRDPLAVPNSYPNIMSHVSARLTNTMTRFSIKGNMIGNEDSEWLPTVSPSGTRAFQIYATGLTISTAYGFFSLRLRVQFRSGH